MKHLAPRQRLATAAVLFAACLIFAPCAFADGGWTPDTSCADKFKMGKSGQIYSWRKGECWGHPGTWFTFVGKRKLIWCGPWSATPERIMKGMGLRRAAPKPAAKAPAAKATPAKGKAKAAPAKATATKTGQPAKTVTMSKGGTVRVVASPVKTAPKPRAKAKARVQAKAPARKKPAPAPKRMRKAIREVVAP